MASKPQPAQNLASRFTESFAAFLEREDGRPLPQQLELAYTDMAAAACAPRRFSPDVNELLRVAANQMAGQSVDGMIRSIIEGIGETCESPLEVSLCLAIGVAARALDYGILFDFRDSRVFGDPEGDITVRIRPQVNVGEYRVDFVVSMRIIEGPADDLRVSTATTVVECDGFKFHDATRESAAKDRERDRALQSAGLPILRFAGREIWADVFQCAGAVLLFLLERAKAERIAGARKPPSSERLARVAFDSTLNESYFLK
jgi:very-short-patch-repair endonuclease